MLAARFDYAFGERAQFPRLIISKSISSVLFTYLTTAVVTNASVEFEE